MASTESKQILCVLFCDLKGYSQLKDNDLKNRVFKEIQRIFERIREEEAQFVKSTGDGIMACSPTPLPLALTALRLRDTFKTTDWATMGFPQDLLLRIGLHLGEAVVHRRTDDTIADLIGEAVDVTSRIEGATDNNAIFCSKPFNDMLNSGSTGKVRSISLGLVALPKQYGEKELFELVWAHEARQTPVITHQSPSKIPMPNIRKPFTDKSKKDFLRYSFGVIRGYFEEALKELDAHAPMIEATLTNNSETKFIIEVYRDGEFKASGKIWLGSFGHSTQEEIYFRQDRFHLQSDNAYNESIAVMENGDHLALRTSLGAMGLHITGAWDTRQPSTPEQIAEYLWLRLIRDLG